jgi:prefoldin subunit 5
MEKRIITAIISVMAMLMIGLGTLVYLQLRPGQKSEFIIGGAEAAVDSSARIEIELLRSQIDRYDAQIERLSEQMKQLQMRISAVESQEVLTAKTAPLSKGGELALVPRDGPNQIIDSYAQVVLIANRRKLNTDLRIASPSYLESVLGRPRKVLSDNCDEMTNPRLQEKLVFASVGPIRVRMLKPAAESLKRVFARIKAADPDLYKRINTAGSLCVRQIRGTKQRSSTHSFGLSVDLNIDGQLDILGDGKTQLGLTILADFFRDEGWYWGAGFAREDSMHFEASRNQVEKWLEEGSL